MLGEISRDEKHLRRLATLHYVVGGLTAALCVVGVPLIVVGKSLMNSVGGPLPEVVRVAAEIQGVRPQMEDPEIRAILGSWLLGGGVIIVVLSLMHGGIIAYVGRCIAKRRRRLFCIMFSIFDLTYILPPLGTPLSIYALTVLLRGSVKSLFKRPAAAPAGETAPAASAGGPA